MKINFKKITLENFRSFQGRHEFYIQDSGLYLVHGTNLVDEKLESNGVGKSSLFEAILYVFRGKTSQGLKRTDVTTWGESKCNVAIDFLIDGTFYRITRASGNPTQLHVKKEEDTCTIPQETIYDFLGIPEHFLYCIVFSQFQPGFFQLKPQERLNYFCEIFDFDIWDTYKENAKKQGKSLADKIMELERKVALCVGWQDATETQQKDLEASQNVWEQEQQSQEAIRKKIEKELSQQKKELQNKSGVLKKLLKPLETKIKALQEEVALVEQCYEEATQELNSADKEVHLAQGKLNTEKSHYKKLESLTSLKNCQFCGSSISTKKIKEQLAQQESCIVSLEGTRKGLSAKAEEFKCIRQSSAEELSFLRSKFSCATKELQDLFAEQNGVTRQLGHIATSLTENASIAKRESPYDILLRKGASVLRVLPNYRRVLQEEILELEHQKTISDYWAATGFHAIKLLLVRNVANSYEILVNTYLEKLGLSEWSVEISMEKELKSGAFKPQFEVSVNSGHTTNTTTPLDAWSGGEVQRLKLAGNFALGDLISFWSNIQSNLLVIDECSEHLSMAGILDLLAISGEKSHFQTVYIIEHKQFETKGEFHGVVEVIKGSEGTRIEV